MSLSAGSFVPDECRFRRDCLCRMELASGGLGIRCIAIVPPAVRRALLIGMDASPTLHSVRRFAPHYVCMGLLTGARRSAGSNDSLRFRLPRTTRTAFARTGLPSSVRAFRSNSCCKLSQRIRYRAANRSEAPGIESKGMNRRTCRSNPHTIRAIVLVIGLGSSRPLATTSSQACGHSR